MQHTCAAASGLWAASKAFKGPLHRLVSRTAACSAAASTLDLDMTADEGVFLWEIRAQGNSMQTQLAPLLCSPGRAYSNRCHSLSCKVKPNKSHRSKQAPKHNGQAMWLPSLTAVTVRTAHAHLRP